MPNGIEGEKQCKKAFKGDYPRCTLCGTITRPAILMFNDMNWTRRGYTHTNYLHWEEVMHVRNIFESAFHSLFLLSPSSLLLYRDL